MTGKLLTTDEIYSISYARDEETTAHVPEVARKKVFLPRKLITGNEIMINFLLEKKIVVRDKNF